MRARRTAETCSSSRKLLRRLLAAGLFLIASSAWAQFLPEEIGERPKWEEYLKTARIVGSLQITGPEAVTEPWKLSLVNGSVTRFGLWKNPEGRRRGFIESWRTEIAAYRLDKILDLYMVPPTVERRFEENAGSLQLWIESEMSLKTMLAEKIELPTPIIRGWNRAIYLQRAFDNLIANEDRHASNLLIMKDWRIILIDHSRSFRTSTRFTTSLINSEHSPSGDLSPKELPRSFLAKIKGLTFASIKAAVGDDLTDDQIRAVLTRRDLILADIDRLIQKNGEDRVLY